MFSRAAFNVRFHVALYGNGILVLLNLQYHDMRNVVEECPAASFRTRGSGVAFVQKC
jgi:hypothetical protein